MKRYVLAAMVFSLFCSAIGAKLFGQVALQQMILDGSEEIVNYGMDTTDNWWAITAPFSDRLRLIVNGDETFVLESVEEPVFSPSGIFWAAMAIYDGQWTLLTNVGDFYVEFDRVGKVVFSRDSRTLSFIGYLAEDAWLARYRIAGGEMEEVLEPMKSLSAINPVGPPILSQKGDKVAYIGKRGNSYSLTINEQEGGLFDEIKPIGFWHNGSFLYAARLGYTWRVYRNTDVISASYQNIPEVAINPDGTVAAFVAQQVSGSVAVMLSDNLPEPSISREYDAISGLVLHPYQELYAFKGLLNNVNSVIFGSARYGGGGEYGALFFTYDGSELIFLDCDLVNCYINVNGKRHTIDANFTPDQYYVVAPGSNTFCYVTSMTLVVRKYEQNEFTAGDIVDEISRPRYNWRAKRYETLGVINDRLYFMVCKL